MKRKVRLETKRGAQRMAAATKPQQRRKKATDERPELMQITGGELEPPTWVTPGAAEGDRETTEEDLAMRDDVND